MSLTHALIGILSREPLHGYDIRQRFEATLGGEWSISYGQLYPALARLTAAGYVDKRSEPGDRASERNVYSVTPAGLSHLRAWLAKDFTSQVRAKDDLSLRLALFDLIDQAAQVDILTRYRTDVSDRLGSLQASLPTIKNRWSTAICYRAIGACELEIAWLDGLLSGLR
jgi:DNA-binding PadR family transcriptional regulator